MKKSVLLFLLLLPLGAKIFLSMSMSVIWRPAESTPPQVQETQATERPEPTAAPTAEPTTAPTTEPATEPTDEPTEATTAPTEPMPTEPPKPYSEDQLFSLSNDWITYGPGTAADGNPPPYAPDAQKNYGKYDAHFLEEAENVIYLTFDCGYEHFVDGVSLTGKILDTLKEKGVKAMFFVTGSYVEQNPELVQRIINEGHILGNHSSEHRSMPSLGIRNMEAQIMDLHNMVETKFGYSMKFFRPPEGSFSLRSLAVTQNCGYETVHWSFAYADWDTANQPDPDAALKKILSCHHDGAIYLLHAVSETNAAILDDVIDGLREEGYRLELLS